MFEIYKLLSVLLSEVSVCEAGMLIFLQGLCIRAWSDTHLHILLLLLINVTFLHGSHNMVSLCVIKFLIYQISLDMLRNGIWPCMSWLYEAIMLQLLSS